MRARVIRYQMDSADDQGITRNELKETGMTPPQQDAAMMGAGPFGP